MKYQVRMEKEEQRHEDDETSEHRIFQCDTITFGHSIQIYPMQQNSAGKHQTSKILYLRCGHASGLTGGRGARDGEVGQMMKVSIISLVSWEIREYIVRQH